MPKNYLHAYDCQQSFLDKKKEVNCVVHFVVDLVVHELKLQIHALKAKNICLVYIFFIVVIFFHHVQPMIFIPCVLKIPRMSMHCTSYLT